MRPYTLTTQKTKNELKNSKLHINKKTHKPTQAHRACSRCSQPLSTNQTPHPTTKAGRQPRPLSPVSPHSGRRDSGPVVSKPNSVSDDFLAGPIPVGPTHVCCAPEPHPLQARPIQRIAQPPNPHTMWAGPGLVVLLRKEVIQPHLPVRLPCYDFVPIADPTFDGSLPRGVRPPASGVTDFHDVTGGVYKARERIHRSVADLRLLATPTSRGRVADPDPN